MQRRNAAVWLGAAAATGFVAAAVLFGFRRRRLRTAQEKERTAVVLRRLRERTTNKLSAKHPIPLGDSGVDLSQVDVATLVNTMSDDTGYLIPDSEKAAFNLQWRRHMRVAFERNGNMDEFEEWQRTGLSNGRELGVQVMILQPNKYFRCHFHPNIEFEVTLAGALHENKMVGVPDIRIEDTGEEGPEKLVSVPSKLSDLPGPLAFEYDSVPVGKFLANAVHSMHQSYTKDDGALILVLWSGQHCNLRPENCSGVSDMLIPGAGWAL